MTPSRRPERTTRSLPVVLPLAPALDLARKNRAGLPPLRSGRGAAGIVLLFLAFAVGEAHAQAGPGPLSIIATIWKWTPLIASGFILNVAISFLAMAIGTVLG